MEPDMKTEEDEAFDDLARRQGMWGGGFPAKRQMAADKLWDRPSVAFDEWWNGDNDESTNPFRLESGAYWAWAGWKAALVQPAQSMKVEGPLHVVCQCDKCKAQTAQEPDALTIVYQSGYHDGKQAALAGREWNFCERCGKRTADLTVIHTCTPPQEKNG